MRRLASLKQQQHPGSNKQDPRPTSRHAHAEGFAGMLSAHVRTKNSDAICAAVTFWRLKNPDIASQSVMFAGGLVVWQ